MKFGFRSYEKRAVNFFYLKMWHLTLIFIGFGSIK
jgi:hypothetical protein